MTGKVTDEMLMAYVDGELDSAAAEDVRRATERDADLARRARDFRAARQWARDAFAEIKAEPVPERLVETILGSAKVVPLWRRAAARTALPLAASLAILVGAAGYWLGQQSPSGGADLLADAAVARTLGQTPSGEARPVRTAAGDLRLETLATYRIEGGHCRSFHLTGPGRSLRGVGCARGQGWRVEIAAAAPARDAYAPASADALAAIDAFLDAAGAGAPMSAEEERAMSGEGAR